MGGLGYLRRRGRGRRFGRMVAGRSFLGVGWGWVSGAVCVGGEDVRGNRRARLRCEPKPKQRMQQ